MENDILGFINLYKTDIYKIITRLEVEINHSRRPNKVGSYRLKTGSEPDPETS